jgi:hypothetical protein
VELTLIWSSGRGEPTKTGLRRTLDANSAIGRPTGGLVAAEVGFRPGEGAARWQANSLDFWRQITYYSAIIFGKRGETMVLAADGDCFLLSRFFGVTARRALLAGTLVAL